MTSQIYRVPSRRTRANGMEALVVGVFYQDGNDEVITHGLNESVSDIMRERGETRRYIEVSLGTTGREFAKGESFDTLMDNYRRTVHGV